ncbi:hypothetical protein Tsubulata_035531 [Turnera subulata]|uniref:Mechanosensitive ion channel protein Msy1/2-like transmembrane domain-containing protein n=1 Tax=Turnera subulata TaxID=218843 RepID=A0A9Q0F2H2_9ROSI|nr:hypothetical protein Tsubulata_035531 [Turnera subulata]
MAHQPKAQGGCETGTMPEKTNPTDEPQQQQAEANLAPSNNQQDSTTCQIQVQLQGSASNESSQPNSPEISSGSRRRSLSRSAYSKPKSRFAAASPPLDDHAKEDVPGSPPSVPRTPPMGSPRGPAYDGEDDDDTYYKKVPLSKRKAKTRLKTKSLLKWFVFLSTLGCLVVSLTLKDLEKSRLWGFEFWRWSVLLMVIVDGLFATKCFMKVVVFFIERNFLLRKKVLYFVHGLKRSAMVFIWSVSVIIVWAALFNHSVKRSEIDKKVFNYATRNLAALVIGTFLWFLKSLWVRMLASKFHVNVFFGRIQASIFDQYVLQTLSGPPVIEMIETIGRAPSAGMLSFRTNTRVAEEEPQGKRDVIDMGEFQKMKSQKVSSWTMKALIDIVKNSGLSTISSDFDDEESERQINSETEAIAAAYNIFRNVARPGCKYIDEEDLLRFMIKEEVDLVFQLLEASETGRIDRKAMTDWVHPHYRKLSLEMIENAGTMLLLIMLKCFELEELCLYLESNPKYWHPNHSVVVKDIQNESKLRMAVDCFHTMNFQNLELKNRRRTELVIELKKIFEALCMKFSLNP